MLPLPLIPPHIQLLLQVSYVPESLGLLLLRALDVQLYFSTHSFLPPGAHRSEIPLQHSAMPGHRTAVMSLQPLTQVNPLFLSAL